MYISVFREIFKLLKLSQKIEHTTMQILSFDGENTNYEIKHFKEEDGPQITSQLKITVYQSPF